MGLIFNNKPNSQQNKPINLLYLIYWVLTALSVVLIIGAIALFGSANSENTNIAGGIVFLILAGLLAIPFIFRRKEMIENVKVHLNTNSYSTNKTSALEFNNELQSIPLVSIDYNHRFLKTNYVKEMPSVTFSIPEPSERNNCGNFVVIDTETTGINITCEIIEISAIKYENFKPIAAFSTLVKPKERIPDEVIQITHITNEMVENSPTIYQIMPAFIEFVGNNNIVGHNLLFDLKFVYKYGFKFQEQPRKYYDTLEISRNKLNNLVNYKLSTVCTYYGIERTDAHRSLSDCLATAKVYNFLTS